MKLTYGQVFDLLEKKEAKGFSSSTLSTSEKITYFTKTLELFKEVETELLKEQPSLPSPKWLEHYGMDSFLAAFGGPVSGMKPESEWNNSRLSVIQQKIREANQVIETLKASL